MEGFLIRGWHLILPAWRWLYPGWGFYTLRGGIDRGDNRFSPRFIGVLHVMYRRIHNPRMGPSPRVALALRTPGKCFHTTRGGIDTGDHRFCPRRVGVIDV